MTLCLSPSVLQSTSAPSLNVTGPSQMTVNSAAIFQVDLVLRNYVTDFVLEVIAEETDSGNPIMKVCDFRLVGSGTVFFAEELGNNSLEKQQN